MQILLTDDLLTISGERLEDTRDGQTLKRSFTRKYSIPPDVHLDSIRSHLSDSGFLIVNVSQLLLFLKTNKQTKFRFILCILDKHFSSNHKSHHSRVLDVAGKRPAYRCIHQPILIVLQATEAARRSVEM